MRTVLVILTATLFLTGSGAAGQSPGPPGTAGQPASPGGVRLVTGDGALTLHAWRSGPSGGLDRVWEARPRNVDPATWNARRGEAITQPRDAALVVADVDGDGSNDLVAGDALGLTVYGTRPAYYPYTDVPNSGVPQVAVGDVDRDGKPDIVVQRTVVETAGLARDVDVLTVTPAGLRSVSKLRLPGYGSVVVTGDADNDGQAEILSGGDTLVVLERRPDGVLERVAELGDTGSMVVAVRIADVDRDRKADVVVGSSLGKVTVYAARKLGTRTVYGVAWQSRQLVTEGLTGANGGAPMASVQGLAVADVTGDGQPDLVAAVFEGGKLAGRDVRAPRVRVLTFNGARDFTEAWTSDALPFPTVSALTAGDLDGDGAAEFVVNGRLIFRRTGTSGAYTSTPTPCTTCTDGVIGQLGELAEPVSATRVVPLYWNVQGRQIAERQTLAVAVTLFNPFSEAKDVAVAVVPGNGRLAVAGGALTPVSIPAGGTATLPPFTLTAAEGNDQGLLRFEITAAGGYRQAVPASLMVAPALPTFQADAAPKLAQVLEAARHENRRALVVWGANADKASQDFILTMVRSGELARTLLYEYEVVRVEASANPRLVSKYKVPRGALPYLTVLDANGAVLAGLPATPFKAAGEGAAAWNGSKLNEALVAYKPAYVDAQPLFTAALDRAKKENKALFLWFNAPW